MCIVTIFVSSDLRKAVPYQRIIQNIFADDADLLVEINESIQNFISKEDLALSQYSNQPEEKRPRLLAEHLTNQSQNIVDNIKSNNSIHAQTQSTLSTQSTTTLAIITTQYTTIAQSTTITQSTFSTPPSLLTSNLPTKIVTTNPLVLLYNIKKEKDVNFTPFCASSESLSNNQTSANDSYPLVEAGPSSFETPTLPSTSGLNSFLMQSPFGTVSSSELKDLPPQILEKINFFSQDNQSISRSQNKSSDLLDDRGGNICNFLLSKETAPGIQI